jgi:beta-lactamase regulating signal transducer with metallopeptidase domain
MMVAERILLVGLAAFGVLGLAATLVVPLVAIRRTRGSAAQRAARLANLRLLPTVIATIGSAIVTAAFIRFEPRWYGENISVAVQIVGALAAALLITSVWRGFQLIRSTRRTAQAWLQHARPISLPGISAPSLVIESDFPVVTVVGLRRPRLVIARSVLDSCSDDELQAILAHEQGHIDRHDNLRRLLLSVAPDILNWFSVSARMFAAWSDAAEEAADDDADRVGEGGRVRLASALLKVARLAPSTTVPAVMPASALYRGESLERRVRRLLEVRQRESSSFPAWPARVALAMVALTSVTMLERVHEVVETLIHILP